MLPSSTRSPLSWMKNNKSLAQALLVSVTLNITFMATLIYFAFKDATKPPEEVSTLIVSHSSPPSERMQTLLGQYKNLSFPQLMCLLKEKEHVESGYTKRDLSLACLVFFHDFNLGKALGTLPESKRELDMGETTPLLLFPGLSEEQYLAIIQYGEIEKWPFSSKGLFRKIQESKFPYDSSLLEAFYLTPEYYFISMLFSKTGLPLKKEYIALLITQASWDKIASWREELKHSLDFSIHKRREFLLMLLIDYRSRLAAKIFAEADTTYCLSFLNNEQITTLCSLLREKTPTKVLTLLLASPRSDAIWEMAARMLYEQAGEIPPEDTVETLLKKAKARFLEGKIPPSISFLSSKSELKSGKTTVTSPVRTSYSFKHTVREGETLWKVARIYEVSVSSLIEANHLNSDQLKVGQNLDIPSK